MSPTCLSGLLLVRCARRGRAAGLAVGVAPCARAWLAGLVSACARGGWSAVLLCLLWLGGGAALPLAARADGLAPTAGPPITLASLDVERSDDGVSVSFALRFDLPRTVEDALLKGVPLNFVAEAEIYRDRWYWLDRRVARVTRTWRLAWQPLTRKYRVSFGGLHQQYDKLPDALAALRRVSEWKIADAGVWEDGSRHYVQFVYKLDTSLLPRPMQIGIVDQPEWTMQAERRQRFN
jgi:hypothetical protein